MSVCIVSLILWLQVTVHWFHSVTTTKVQRSFVEFQAIHQSITELIDQGLSRRITYLPALPQRRCWLRPLQLTPYPNHHHNHNPDPDKSHPNPVWPQPSSSPKLEHLSGGASSSPLLTYQALCLQQKYPALCTEKSVIPTEPSDGTVCRYILTACGGWCRATG